MSFLFYNRDMNYYVNDHYLHIAIYSLMNHDVQDFFNTYIPSKKIQHLLIQNKWIRIDETYAKRETVLEGKELIIDLYPEEHYYERKSNRELDIVYEDELFLIVNKPNGLLVHSDGSTKPCVSDMVESYFAYQHNEYEITPLHRLDEETSGLLVYSKSMIFGPLLDKLLSEKKIRRRYLAFVKGKVDCNVTMNIDAPIGKDRHDASRRIVYKNGQKALTKVKSLGFSNQGYSILQCSLSTGRTHQIRVHLSHQGYPILNDKLYGVPSTKLERMGLFAKCLEFYHPLKEEEMKVEAALPYDMQKLYDEIV